MRMSNTEIGLTDWAALWNIRIGQMTGSGIGFDTGPYETYTMSNAHIEGTRFLSNVSKLFMRVELLDHTSICI